MLEICKELDPRVQQEVLDLRYEYDKKKTREAQIASTIDKIE